MISTAPSTPTAQETGGTHRPDRLHLLPRVSPAPSNALAPVAPNPVARLAPTPDAEHFPACAPETPPPPLFVHRPSKTRRRLHAPESHPRELAHDSPMTTPACLRRA